MCVHLHGLKSVRAAASTSSVAAAPTTWAAAAIAAIANASSGGSHQRQGRRMVCLVAYVQSFEWFDRVRIGVLITRSIYERKESVT